MPGELRRVPGGALDRPGDSAVVTGLPLGDVIETRDPADPASRSRSAWPPCWWPPAPARVLIRLHAAPAATGSPPPPAGSPSCRWTAARWRCAERVPDGRHRPAHRGRPGRRRAQPDARPRRRRAGRAAGQRDPGAPVRRRRQPRAAHAAGRDPRLRRAEPARARRRAAGRGARAAPGRVRGRPDDHARRGPAAAGPARRRPAAARASRSTCRALVVDAVSDAHVAGPEHRWRLDLPDGGRAPCPATPPGCTRCWPTCWPTPGCTPRPAPRSPSALARPTATARSSGSSTTAPASRRSCCRQVFERFARGDTSRSRAAGSTGLGLAIVAAVVAAHRRARRRDQRAGPTPSSPCRLPRLIVRLTAAAQTGASPPAEAGWHDHCDRHRLSTTLDEPAAPRGRPCPGRPGLGPARAARAAGRHRRALPVGAGRVRLGQRLLLGRRAGRRGRAGRRSSSARPTRRTPSPWTRRPPRCGSWRCPRGSSA